MFITITLTQNVYFDIVLFIMYFFPVNFGISFMIFIFSVIVCFYYQIELCILELKVFQAYKFVDKLLKK